MKVLIFPEYSNFGGTLSFLKTLVEFCQKKNFEIAVAIEPDQQRPEMMKFFETNSVKVFTIKHRKKLFRIPYISLIYDIFSILGPYRSFRPNLIFASNGTPRLMLGAFAFPRPVIFMMHTYPFKSWRPFMAGWVRIMLLFKKNTFATVSKASAVMIHRKMGAPIHRIAVIPNSYEPSITRGPSAHCDESLGETVLTLGHCSWYKDPFTWFNVALVLVQARPKVQFVWVGAGEESLLIQEMIKKSGWQDQIHLVNTSERLLEYYSRASVYFQPSLVESHGIAVVDAMANGIPVVTSTAGGLPESNIDGETGFTCAPGDVDAFARQIIKLLENPSLRAEMGKAAKMRAEKTFSKERQQELISNLIHSAVST